MYTTLSSNTENNPSDTFDRILGELSVFRDPNLLKPEFIDKIKTEGVDKKKIEKYHQLLVHINQFYKKIQKYPLYFSEFYPPSQNINDYEALEHHVHAYLEDVDILKNKIQVFLGVLKNDLKTVALNKKEIEYALEWLIKQVQKVFKGTTDHRNPHHHRGMKFLDSDIVDAEIARTLLSVPHPLNALLKPESIPILKERAQLSFKKAKERWVRTAEKNNVQITGLVNDIFERVGGFMYDYLEIEPIDFQDYKYNLKK